MLMLIQQPGFDSDDRKGMAKAVVVVIAVFNAGEGRPND